MGAIQAIQELELHIRQIGPDKISDLIANIILHYLARFTEEACAALWRLHPPLPRGRLLEHETLEWDSGYFNLPSHDIHSYILVPSGSCAGSATS